MLHRGSGRLLLPGGSAPHAQSNSFVFKGRKCEPPGERKGPELPGKRESRPNRRVEEAGDRTAGIEGGASTAVEN